MASTDVQLRPRHSPRSINPDRRHTVVVGLKASKFRHVAVTSGGKEGTFINLRQVNTRLRIESNAFCINERWAAVPLSVAGGVITILDLHKPTKIADGVIPGLENGANLADFAWNPFDQSSLAVGCDNGMVNLWTIPSDGILTIQSTPEKSFKAHADKINVIKFNPVASDVLATAANNGEIIVWNLNTFEGQIRLEPSSHGILAMSWSSDGKYLAVVSRDCVLRVYEPRANNIPIVESHVLETPKGARVMFVCNDRFLLVSSLTKSSQRTINLYSAKNLALIHAHPLDSSSKLLIPHYDFDSSVVFLTGSGDRTIQMFEIHDEAPYLLQLAPFQAPNSHQAIAFTAKNAVDVRKVEFARGARLLLSELENATFKVPRVKMDFFQNDLFPPALVTWEPAVDAASWFRGVDVARKFHSLKPNDMEPLYNDIYVVDMARYASGNNFDPPTPNSTMTISSSTNNGDASMIGKDESIDDNHHHVQNGKHHDENANGNIVENKPIADEPAPFAKYAQGGGPTFESVANGNATMMGPAFAQYRQPIPSYASMETPPSAAATIDTPDSNGSGGFAYSVLTRTKLIDDGLVLTRPRAESDAPTSGTSQTTPPQAPKRLSLDPASGTPLRDLLRRCDEMPSVMAMRKSDEEGNGCVENQERDKDWE